MYTFKAEERIALDEGIHIGKFSGEKPEPPHMHDFLEFVYIYSGEGVQNIDGVCYRVDKGDLLFIRCNQVHSFYTDTEMIYVNFCIRPEFFAGEMTDEELEYVDGHCFENLTLSELATKSFYNPSYFCRIFKQCYGVSLKSYIQTKRINRAMELLAKTDKTAAEISEEVGYHDKAQFYQIFKKNTGVTPKEYREGKRNAGFDPTVE